jgi:hypothetical protein
VKSVLPAEIPLLLKGPLVRQFLAGRKTVTRRMNVDYWSKKKPGDLIWFRETSAEFDNQRFYEADADLVRDDSGERVGWWLGDRFIPGEMRPFKWQPSIHMPKAAARCWAEIVSIRMERLQEITDAEIKAEGVFEMGAGWPVSVFDGKAYGSALQLWITVWESINGRKPGARWADNPMVARIEFRRIER